MMPSSDTPDNFKSGFVAIVGAPNAGKSTLLNRMLGEKVSITSSKPQTTRNRVMGVLHRPSSQMIFIDTPGVHRARGVLNERIVETALTAIGDVDLILVLVDAARRDPASENYLVQRLADCRKPMVLALNKIDLIAKSALLTLIDEWRHRFGFKAVVPVSARHGTQLEALMDALEGQLQVGPAYFPADTLTDMPERFIVAEMIREKVFRMTGEEIPYAAAVSIDEFKEDEQRPLVRIAATIHVERGSQKAIIIGAGGAKLKEIGIASRQSIERLLGSRVYLKLFVRVQKNWRKDTRALRRFGY